MPIRIRVEIIGHVGGHLDIVCPDDVEVSIRGVHPPPLHVVAWAVLEATEPSVHENIAALMRIEFGAPPFAAVVHMGGVAELPVSTCLVGRGVYHIPGSNGRKVAVTFLDQQMKGIPK